jgi:hypothetical protein
MNEQLNLWQNFIRTIKTGSLPFRLNVRPGQDERPVLVVTLEVLDVNDGHQSVAGTSEILPPFPGTIGFQWHPEVCAKKAEELVFSVVKRVWLHELQEQWNVGGRRVRDPHAAERSDGVGVEFIPPEWYRTVDTITDEEIQTLRAKLLLESGNQMNDDTDDCGSALNQKIRAMDGGVLICFLARARCAEIWNRYAKKETNL